MKVNTESDDLGVKVAALEQHTTWKVSGGNPWNKVRKLAD